MELAKMLRSLIIAFVALALVQPSVQRTLLQDPTSVRISAKLYSGQDNGGLSLVSNYTLTYSYNGTVTAGTVNASQPGFPLSLSVGDLLLSDTFSRAGCFNVSLSPAASGIGGFVSTYGDVVGTTTSNGVFRISTAVILNGTNISSSDASPHYGSADPNEDYVFLIYNLGTRGSSTKVQITANTAAGCTSQISAPAPTELTPFTASAPTVGSNSTGSAIAPATSTVGILPVQNSTSSGTPSPTAGRKLQQFTSSNYASAPAEGPDINAQFGSESAITPAPGPSSTQTDSVQISREDALSDSSLVWLGAFTNMSCIAHKLLAQQEDIFGYTPPRIDVSIFLLDEADTISWANQDFSLTPDNITFQAITLQNNSNNEDLFRYINNLNPSARYFLWAVTGMQNADIVSSDIVLNLAYTGQSSGSCSNNLVSQYDGSVYGYSSPSPSGSAIAPTPSSQVRGSASNGSSNPVGSAPTPASTTSSSTPTTPVPSSGGGLQLQGGGSTAGGSGLFSLPGKKLKLL